jgi:hypothetical protein
LRSGGGSATNGATLSCFQGIRLNSNFKSPRTGLFNQIELVQELPDLVQGPSTCR